MANGVRKSKLLRKIRKEGSTANWRQVNDLLSRSEARLLSPMFYDTEYRVVPRDVWDLALRYSNVDSARYLPERRDCDDFAFWLKGQLSGKLALNGIGIVADIGWGHAYNILLVGDSPHQMEVIFCEPQNDRILSPNYIKSCGGLARGHILF